MTEKHQIREVEEIPLGLKIIAFGNIIFGFLLIVAIFPSFILSVVLGYVDYNIFCGFWDWFLDQVIVRFILSIFYFSAFLLFWSGVDILNNNLQVKKSIVVSASTVVFSVPAFVVLFLVRYNLCSKGKLDFQLIAEPARIFITLLFVYSLILLIYVCSNHKYGLLSNAKYKVSIKIVLIIFIVLYLLGFWFGKIFFN
jgi:hypothetical protein